ncbi:30S ribosomal protein S20 [bacterium]|nr:30S ribosomal protein S20 [bacterium]
MPTTKSAKKALRQNIKRRQRNIKRKGKVKNLQKKILSLVSEKKIEEAKKVLPQFYQALDKAVKSKTIKKNTASRKKSRVSQLINKNQS